MEFQVTGTTAYFRHQKQSHWDLPTMRGDGSASGKGGKGATFGGRIGDSTAISVYY